MMFGLSPMELIVIGSIAVLLFGSRLPSVARPVGKRVTGFKKGLRGIEGARDTSTNSKRVTSSYAEDREEPTAPKSEPHKGEPVDDTATEPAAEETAGTAP